MDPESLAAQIAEDGVRLVDLRFTDLAGRWRHSTLEASRVDAALLDRGIMIDGSLVPGWRDIAESDLLIKPDLDASFKDPFTAQPTLILVADATEPTTRSGYERDPRSAARLAEERLRASGLADQIMVSVDLGFFLFDDVRIDFDRLSASYAIATSEIRGGCGERHLSGAVHAHRPAPGGAHLSLAPTDHHSDIRAEMVTVLSDLGFHDLRHEHGPTPSQNRIAIGAGGLVETADRLQMLRYVVHQVAAAYGKAASFMPKPIADEPMATFNLSLSLWQDGRPLFAGAHYADLSPLCLSFIAGILAHGRALNALTNPTSNSYKRLQPGMEEPTLLTYAAHNRSAAVRIPFADQPGRKRVECRFPDPAANPYLALTALLQAGLDGIERKLEPGDAMDRNVYDLKPEEVDGIPVICRSLEEALHALEADHEFLTRDEIVPLELIESFIDVKRRELDYIARRPTPVEFELYFGL